jgi:uncharacterized protein (TIGR03437 family)
LLLGQNETLSLGLPESLWTGGCTAIGDKVVFHNENRPSDEWACTTEMTVEAGLVRFQERASNMCIHPSELSGRLKFAIGLLAVAALTASNLPAQGPPEVFPGGVVNAASFRPPDFPGGHLAPGAIISIFGRGLGPQAGAGAPGFPLPTELGPLQTRVRINDMEQCRLLFVSDGQINCELPPDLIRDQDRDQIRLRIITNLGESDEIVVPFGRYGFGLFAMNGKGRGPLVAQNFTGAADPQQRYRLNRPDEPAEPGQIMVLWGTGLGPTDPPVQAGQPVPGQALAIHQPEVWVGGFQAQVQYAGRAPGFAGLDQIQFVMPEDAPAGCAVPIHLQIRDQDRLHVSNVGTVALTRDRDRDRDRIQQCLDPTGEVIAGLSHGSIVIGSGLGMLGRGQLGPQPMPGGPYGHAGGMGPGGMGPAQGMGGGVSHGPGGVGPTGIGPYGLHPGIPPHAGGLGVGLNSSLGPDVITARFVRLAADAGADIGIPPAATNSCNVYSQGPGANSDLFFGAVELLDAGTLMLTGPGVSMTVSPEAVNSGVLYAANLPGPLQQGTYLVSGAGGSAIGAFGPVDLDVSSQLDVTTSLEPGTTISRAAGLTIDWDDAAGNNPGEIVLIHGRSFHVPGDVDPPVTDPMQYQSQAFVCTTTVGAGEFTVPEHVIATLPDGVFILHVTHMPPAEGISRFEATGLDLGGVFRWIYTTTYLDLILGP